MGTMNFYTKKEEIANAITHGIGVIFSIVALVLLVVFATKYKDAWYTVSYSIYGSTLIILYMCSTLYHSFTNEKVKKIFRKFDHSSIFLLIAGTYTPFTLTILRGKLGWSILGIIWVITIVGIVLKIVCFEKMEKVSTFLYIAMGWVIVVALKSIISSLPVKGIVLLIAGGLIYTVGCIFYAKDKIPYNHAIWHVFVLGGSVCHFFSILLYL
ncbi:hemolysin D [Clostridium tetani]|uniref:Hemolysin III n=1 Tax=Clostridium tetani (strain Massachusetts / E88) TaxID=212717 RepID=Q897Y4_CLOTE|nr:hemolysin III family protein [Clostridium tetani]AAO35202.1 hemolysin III [Clostridium tetani E88]AVP54842.1 hemolysin D [Clostridium tetani]KGI38463.1 hemolysin D [Clostridium tetani ATCC 9441]KGI40912.1 hemolysin D [Clostridium tetani]KGI41582.1 hemolysin D [Clostridium tetani]